MIKKISLINLAAIVFLWGCLRQTDNDTNREDIPSAETAQVTTVSDTDKSVLEAFKQVMKGKEFLKEMALDDEEHATVNLDNPQIIHGDLNEDDTPDALLYFSVEGRGGGNNADFHYAIFLNRSGQWQYQGQTNMGGSTSDYYITLDSIHNGLVSGKAMSMKDESLDPYRVIYKYANGELINTFMELHQGAGGDNEFMTVYGFLSAGYKNVPARGVLTELQKILGKEKITTPKTQEDCGALFEESDIRYYENSGFVFEANDKNEVAFKQVELKGSGIVVYTDKGTLSADTRLQDMKRYFNEQLTERNEGNRKVLQVFAGESIDDQLLLYFDQQGKLESVVYFVQC